VEFPIPAFGKLMTNFKSVPDLRADIRKKMDVHTPSLVEILNKFIENAKKHLPEHCTQNEIVDNLDRIVPIVEKDGRTNYERIFLDRRNLMRGLNCHVIYTVPISMVYSSYATNLAEDYGQSVVMPMITIKTKDNKPYVDGIEILKKIVQKRLEKANVQLSLDNLFESDDALEELCRKSGGYVRNLMQLMQASVKNSPKFPIPDRAANRAISELREIYRKSIYAEDWKKLAEVAVTKGISQDSEDREYRELLFRRCVLEYRITTSNGMIDYWQDVHPLIESMEEFVSAFVTALAMQGGEANAGKTGK